jgi:tetratricopeptide (TPR) repeat protein
MDSPLERPPSAFTKHGTRTAEPKVSCKPQLFARIPEVGARRLRGRIRGGGGHSTRLPLASRGAADGRDRLMPLVNWRQIVFLPPVRSICVILGITLACLAIAEEVDPLELERAVQLESAAGDVSGAEKIYKRLVITTGGTRRARAEATYRLADLYSRQAKNAEAKTLFLQLLRDFPEATDLIPLAELELMKVTALLTRDQIGTNVGSMQHLGDLSISLLGALENNEKERSTELLTRLNTTLESLGSGGDAPEVLVRLKMSAAEIRSTLHSERGGIRAARTQLEKSKDFEPFLQRGFPSDPHDIFAPAWRMKDRLARALAANNPERAKDVAMALERYLFPLMSLPTGQREGTVARSTTYAARDAMLFAQEGKFAEARKRIDEFDEERNQQFGDFRPVAALLMRTPEQVVAAAWAVLYRAEQARKELSKRAYATAMDHVEEAVLVCRQVIPRIENSEASALFKHQQEALEAALEAIKSDSLGVAQQALKRASERP